MRVASYETDESDVLWSSEFAQVRTCSVSSMDNNVYLVTCARTHEQVLIDAADDAPRIEQMLGHGSGDIAGIITTHRHDDHHRALRTIQASTHATTYAGREDAAHLPVACDVSLDHGDVVQVGDLELAVIALRGHTPGSIAVVLGSNGARGTGEGLIFTGDSLFPGGPGKTESAEDFASLMHDLQQRVFDVFDDSALVLPGHGDGTTIGAERPHLQEWLQRGW